MALRKILKQVKNIQEQSIKRKKTARVQILLDKRAIHEAFMTGCPIVGDEVVKHFDLFSGYSMLRIVYKFDGHGGISDEMYAIKDRQHEY